MSVFEISTELRRKMGKAPHLGEVKLTTALLEQLGQRSRVHHYVVSQRQESEIGADWLWLIFTNSGAYGFLVQAKKLRRFGPDDFYELRSQVRYMSRAGGYQMETLLKIAESIGVPALYAFYSNVHNTFLCDGELTGTPEGVFFDTAQNLHRFAFEEDIQTVQCPNLMPMSCIFSSLSRKCHYQGAFELCESCKKCGQYRACAQDWMLRRRKRRSHVPRDKMNRTKCTSPFTWFFREHFAMDIPTLDCGTEMYPMFWAETVMKRSPKMVLRCMTRSLIREEALLDKIGNIVICEYMNKHAPDYVDGLLGPEVVMDYDTVWEKDRILEVLSEKRKNCRLLKQVGLFGSYARGNAHGKSDIDIALRYKKRAKADEESLEELIRFMEEIMAFFQKHIDFVDYNAACGKPESREFIQEINEYMVWV